MVYYLVTVYWLSWLFDSHLFRKCINVWQFHRCLGNVSVLSTYQVMSGKCHGKIL